MIRLRPIARAILDAVLPPLCLSCKAMVSEPGALCAACWEKLDFLGAPHCACCGHPFTLDAGPDALCGVCSRSHPAFRRARAVFRYGDESKALVLRLKHADRTDTAPAFGRWMARGAGELLRDADLLAPVPLHRWRLFRRRFNQSAMLALAIGQAGAKPVEPDLLVRRRATQPQGHLSRAGRARNVQGAFALRPGAQALVADRTILLVDDVLTTGATVEECARVLLRAGASAVDVITLARVVLTDPQ
jgi:ComF family protein